MIARLKRTSYWCKAVSNFMKLLGFSESAMSTTSDDLPQLLDSITSYMHLNSSSHTSQEPIPPIMANGLTCLLHRRTLQCQHHCRTHVKNTYQLQETRHSMSGTRLYIHPCYMAHSYSVICDDTTTHGLPSADDLFSGPNRLSVHWAELTIVLAPSCA